MSFIRPLAVLASSMFIAAVAFADPPKSSSKPPDKKTTAQQQPKSGSSLDNLNVDSTKITAAEGDTASAIRGATASQPSAGDGAKLTVIKRGSLSPDTENKDNEPDPPFVERKLAPLGLSAAAQLVTPAGQMRLHDMPKVQEIAAAASNKLADGQIHVALLGQHKYMINDCLGVKVSVGEFDFKLANPSVKIVDEGVVSEFKVDKISFSVFKLRFRPDVFDAVHPCHFSGRYELGGEARDVSIKLTYNPLVDVEKCQVGNPGSMDIKVACGKVLLHPLPQGINDLGDQFKDMIVDGINYTLNAQDGIGGDTGVTIPVPMIGARMVDMINKAMKENCPFKDSNVGQAAQNTVSKTASGATAAAPTVAAPFTVKPIPNAHGRLGRITVKMPEGCKDTRYVICKAGDKKEAKAGYGAFETTLIPGQYDVYISKKIVPAVDVQPVSETTVAVGALKTSADKDTKVIVYDSDGKNELHEGYGTYVIALPPGKYVMSIGGVTTPITIKADEVAEY